MKRLVKLLVFSLLVTCCVGQGVTPQATEPKDQYGTLTCGTNANGIMEAKLYVFKNTTKTTTVSFIRSDFSRYTEAGCQWTGTGTQADPFTVTVYIDPATNQPPAGQDGCGHSVIRTNEAYEWLGIAQRDVLYHQDGDVLFQFKCNIFGLPEVITTEYRNQGRGVTDLPSPIGSLSLNIVSGTATSSSQVTSVQIGSDYFIRLRLHMPGRTGGADSLFPWGVYCEKLFVTPDPNYQLRQEQLLDASGCPNTDRGLDAGFTGTKPAQDDALFYAFAGPMEAWRFDKSADFPSNVPNTVHFVCEARLCWRDEDTDCLQRCGGSSRRKRATPEETVNQPLDDVYVIHTTLTITEEENTKTETEANYLVPVSAGVGGLVLLILLVIVACLVCMRRKSHDRRTKDASSISSQAALHPVERDGRIFYEYKQRY